MVFNDPLKRIIPSIFIFLSTFTLCFANPQITSLPNNADNVVGHGESIIISGQGFGNKSIAAPVRWDTFETGALGSDVDSEGFWIKENPGANVFSDNYRRGESTKAIKSTYTAGSSGEKISRFYADNALPGLGKKYVSFWVYVKHHNLIDTGSWQFKLWRISAGPAHADYPHLALQGWYYANGMPKNYYENLKLGGSYKDQLSAHNVYPDEWCRLELELEESSGTNIEDGNFTVRTLCPTAQKTSGYYNTSTTANGNRMAYPKFGYGMTNAVNGQSSSSYIDDIYIDNSWARIEVGDASKYSDCTHREMQIPINWGDGSIQFEFNRGSFTQGQTVYIFVVDENGLKSNTGFPVIVGQPKGQSPSPKAPTGLIILEQN